ASLQRITVDKDHVGVVSGLDFSELVGLPEQLTAESSGCENGFHFRVAEELHKVLKVTGVGAVRSPSKAGVSARWNPDATLARVLDAFDGDFQFLRITAHFHSFLQVAKFACFVEGGYQPVDGRGDKDTVLGSFEHVHALLVNAGGVVNHVHARFQREVDGFTATGVRTDLDATAVGFVDCDLELFFGNKGLFCCPVTGDFFTGEAHLDVVDALAGGRGKFHSVSAVAGSRDST